jgi:hypothetical protein
MTNKNIKKYSTSFAIREMQITTTLRVYFTPVRIPIMKKTKMADASEDMGKRTL